MTHPAALLLLAAVVVGLVAPATPARPQPADTAVEAQPRAVMVEYEGIIHPVATEVFDDVIRRADESGAAVAIIVLRTPGGLLDSTRAIVSRMIAARTPIVVFVAPSGAQAASAGFLIALAADVIAMAPGTNLGAAHPVAAGGGPPGDETIAKKVTEDTAAFARSLAEARGRNTTLAAEAVTDSKAFTDREALAAQPPLIDLSATDVDDLLAKLDGRRITRFDGRSMTLATKGAVVERVEITWRQRFLGAIAHPQIAYLLLTLGMLGLVVELWTPGAILPGVVGGLCLLLAFFAFQVLPVNAVGFLLLAFGLGLLVLELKVPSFGVLGIGGTAAMLIGSVMITRDIPGIQVEYTVIVPAVLAVAGIFLFLGRLALKSQHRAPVSGAEGLIGERGQALTSVRPDAPGQVAVHGEIWRATSRSPIPAGRAVRVIALRGLTAEVEPADAHETQGATT